MKIASAVTGKTIDPLIGRVTHTRLNAMLDVTGSYHISDIHFSNFKLMSPKVIVIKVLLIITYATLSRWSRCLGHGLRDWSSIRSTTTSPLDNPRTAVEPDCLYTAVSSLAYIHQIKDIVSHSNVSVSRRVLARIGLRSVSSLERLEA